MTKNTLLFLISLLISFYLPFRGISSASAQITSTQRICNFTPNGAITGNVTLSSNCVIYEDVNGAANGNIILSGNSVTLYRTMVWYPGYEIQINNATIFVNSNAEIVQAKICYKDADNDLIPAPTGLTVDPETGVTLQPVGNLKQLDTKVSDASGTCPSGYKTRESFSTLAYADTDDASQFESTGFFTEDSELLSMGFEIDGVKDAYAAAGDVIVGGDPQKNLIITGIGKLGIGLTAGATPREALDVAGDIAQTWGNHQLNVTQYSDGSAYRMGLSSDAANRFLYIDNMDGDVESPKASMQFRTGSGPSTKMTITSPGNVGIGTAAPGAKLQVDGTYAIDLIRTNYAGQTAGLGIDGVGALWGLALFQGGTQRFTIDSNDGVIIGSYSRTAGVVAPADGLAVPGNVGIGTASPSYTLDVNGPIRSIGAMRVSLTHPLIFETYGGGFYMSDTTWIRTYGSKSFYHNAGELRTDGTLQVGSAGGTFNVVQGGNLSYRTNVLFANTTGNVGIGTAAPGTKLDVTGTGRFSSTLTASNGFTLTAGTLSLPANSVTDAMVSNTLTASTLAANGANCSVGEFPLGVNAVGGAESCTLAYTAAGTHTGLIRSTTAGSSYITGGNVGIGTAAPGAKLHVVGSILQNNTNTLTAKNSAGSVETWMWPRYSDNVMYTNFGASGWSIRNNSSATVMFMQNGGNVGIGTASPVAKLEVASTGNPYIKITDLDSGHQDFYIGSGYGDDFLRVTSDGAAGYLDLGIRNLFFYTGTAGANYLVCKSNGAVGSGIARDCSGDDYAEYFHSDKNMETGTVVVAKDNSSGQSNRPYLLDLSSQPYQKEVIGIVSTDGMIANEQMVDTDQLIALNGQVPTLVSTINGEINVGDPLTSSSVPGVAMKATKAGPVLGKALQSLTNSQTQACANNPSFQCGKINVFLNISLYDPDLFLVNSDNLHIQNQNGAYQTVKSDGSIIDRIGVFDEILSAKLRVGSLTAETADIKALTVNGQSINDLVKAEANKIQQSEIESLKKENKELKSRIERIEKGLNQQINVFNNVY